MPSAVAFWELLWKCATWMKLIFLILVEGSSAGGPISWRRLQFGLLPQNWGLTASTAAYCLLSGSTKQPSRYIRILCAACLILKDQDAHIVFKDGLLPSKRTSLHFQSIQYNITNVLQQRTSALLFQSFVKSSCNHLRTFMLFEQLESGQLMMWWWWE